MLYDLNCRRRFRQSIYRVSINWLMESLTRFSINYSTGFLESINIYLLSPIHPNPVTHRVVYLYRVIASFCLLIRWKELCCFLLLYRKNFWLHMMDLLHMSGVLMLTSHHRLPFSLSIYRCFFLCRKSHPISDDMNDK